MENGVEHVIRLADGGPWGFRLAGGADYRCPLQVAKIRVNSKAYIAGVEEGDVILKLDDKDVRLASHRDVRNLIEHGGDDLSLTVLRGVEAGPSLYKTFLQTSCDNRSSQLTALNQQSVEASLVRSREPSISRAQVTLGRAPSPGRSLRILTGSQSRDVYLHSAGKPDRLLRVDTTPASPVEYKSFQSQIEPGRLPPAKPGKSIIVAPAPVPIAIHRASSLPRTTPGSSVTRIVHPVVNTPEEGRQNRTPFSTQRFRNSHPVVVPIKPFEMPKKQSEIVEFRVRNVNAPKHLWQPTNIGSPGQSPGQNGRYPLSKEEQHQKEPVKFYWELMENQPGHIPGMVDPLIVDDTQGDFGGNPIIHPERELYADSSFYTTKDRMYPTIPEQMRLCRMISNILEAPGAMRSRGGKMFHERKTNADKWAKESMGRKYEPPYIGLDAEYNRPYSAMPHWPSRMKENLTIDELERLEHNTENISKHDMLPPVVAFDINSALTRSRNHGKGVDIYRRNAERAEEFTIDETNRQRTSHINRLDCQLIEQQQQQQKYKSPWRAAWEGNLERAFAPNDPCAAQSVRDEPDLRQDTSAHALGFDHKQATFGVRYKGYAPVRAPHGPGVLSRQISASTSALDMAGREQPRLQQMIGEREAEQPTFDTYTYKWCLPSYYDGRRKYQETFQPGAYHSPTNEGMRRYSSMADLTLRRPKEYIKPAHFQLSNTDQSTDCERLGPPPMLRRPRDFQGQKEYYGYNSPYAMPSSPNMTHADGNLQPGISVF